MVDGICLDPADFYINSFVWWILPTPLTLIWPDRPRGATLYELGSGWPPSQWTAEMPRRCRIITAIAANTALDGTALLHCTAGGLIKAVRRDRLAGRAMAFAATRLRHHHRRAIGRGAGMGLGRRSDHRDTAISAPGARSQSDLGGRRAARRHQERPALRMIGHRMADRGSQASGGRIAVTIDRGQPTPARAVGAGIAGSVAAGATAVSRTGTGGEGATRRAPSRRA